MSLPRHPTVAYLCLVRPHSNEQRHIQLRWFGARPAVQRIKSVPSLVCAVVCFCAWLLRISWVENDFVVNITRGHGCSVSAQRFPMRPRSLPLYGTIFHPLRCYFPRLWPGASAAWTVRVEVDRRRDNHWRLGLLLHSGVVSRSVSAKKLRSLTKTMKPAGPERCSFSVLANDPARSLSPCRWAPSTGMKQADQ